MLEFLPLISSGLQLLGQGSAVKNIAKGYVPTAAEGSQGQLLGSQNQSLVNQSRLLQALLNPNDVITKNVTAAENQALQSETQRALSNLLAANRKAKLMGRTSYFNPEREDEAISQFLTRQTDTNVNTARSNALQRILGVASGYGTNAGGYGSNASGYANLATTQRNAQNVNNAAAPTAFGALSDIVKQFTNGGSMSNIFSMLSGAGA